MSYGNQVEEVLRILILKYIVEQTKLSALTSKLEGTLNLILDNVCLLMYP